MLSATKVRVNWMELCEGTKDAWYYPEKVDRSDVKVGHCENIDAPIQLGNKNMWTFNE